MKKLSPIFCAIAALLAVGCSEPEEASKPTDPALDAAGPPKFQSGESVAPQGAPSQMNSEFK